ncbi:MAG: alanine racemase [Rhodospirillales bacterium]|nr:alanine racemase [Rhodospirillales bacterium]
MALDDLLTPALVLDAARLHTNARKMRERAEALGVALRPHMKTAKSAEVAKAALAGAKGKGLGGVTVATLREAEYFLDHGFRDITYAVCIVPKKLALVATLTAQGADLKILTDDAGVASAIAGDGRPFQVLIEIDCGEHRTGVAPDSPQLLEIAEILGRGGNVTVAGVLTHAGHSYACRSPDEMAKVAEDERAAAVAAAARLRDAGFACPTVSVGSTPTARYAKSLEGVTEMRPGVYLLGDLYQAGIGTCAVTDIAASVLASVIAHRRGENALLIDAGGLALSKDRATQALPEDQGYGLVCDMRTGTPFAGVKVTSVHQEHGHVTADAPLPFEKLPVGAKVRVLPNHVCMTAAAYDTFHVIDGQGRVTATWDRCHGW